MFAESTESSGAAGAPPPLMEFGTEKEIDITKGDKAAPQLVDSRYAGVLFESPESDIEEEEEQPDGAVVVRTIFGFTAFILCV